MFDPGILTVGSHCWCSGLRSTTAEIFNPKNGRSCIIGKIPVATDSLSLCGNLACGGWDFEKSCSRFDGPGTFTTLPDILREKRVMHLCWKLQSEEVLLLGGRFSGTTTERVAADGTSSRLDFKLPYNIKFVFYLMNVTIIDTTIVVGLAVLN